MKSARVSVHEKQFKKFPTDFGIKEREMYANIVIFVDIISFIFSILL